MDYEAGEYQKLAIRQYPARALRETAEGRYWKQFKAPLVAQQVGAVSHIDFSPVYPFHYAITSSTRVIIYDANTRQVRRTISRFKDRAYSGCFRRDGKLLVAGGEDAVIQVFDANSRTLLRQLKGHKRPVRVARYAFDRLHVLSGSDDATVRLWDVSAGEQVARLTGHTDYVRAAAASPLSSDTWATGGYDHVVKLWDLRAKQAVMTLEHGAPVEDVAFFFAGGLLVSAGGTSALVWDLVGGGRPLARLANHQKTVTCVALSPHAGPDSAAAPRLLTGSLDGHVKVYELDSYRVTHASRYPSPVLSLGLSPDCGLLAVGMADGALSVRRHARPKPAAPGTPGAAPQKRARYGPKLTAANYRYIVRGRSEKAAADDVRIAAQRRARLAPYDRDLRQFRYRAALDAALASGRPEVVASVLGELAARAGLSAALGGRDEASLAPLLAHVARHIADPRHTRLLAGVAHRLLDAYGSVVGASPEVDHRLRVLRERVACEKEDELVFTKEALISAQHALKASSHELSHTKSQLADLKGELGSTKSQNESMRREMLLHKRSLDAAHNQLHDREYELRASTANGFWTSSE
ncbi:hypothetical protein WJX81_000200 [Elliptochloris bilobata]|uniref:U3 small nucleolar RNA-associated protein 15 C-terminal domain-containing protein n=1 Tax=Elliptochloris bilobata TaxID=381761 RepID=A0AAW1S833_9CHLO